MMGADEEGTLARLKSARAGLIDKAIVAHRGRIVKTTGDGILVEFVSAVDAARCSTAIQEAMPRFNTGAALDTHIVLRIGIHVGDIIADDGDIFGEGVNIAARLEGICDAGGIYISDDAYRQVRGKIETPYEDIGERRLKNIAEPIRVWRFLQKRQPARITGAIALLSKPSLAILPFQNMSGDPNQEFLADGLADDIITALSRYPSMLVIGRSSSFTFKDRKTGIGDIARQLGVRYLLDGSVRKSGSRIRVSAQLVEADTGTQIWGERYDRDLFDIFAVQDEIADATTIRIAPAIASAERRRALRKSPASLDAWEAYQRGMWHLSRSQPADNAHAEQLFLRATQIDPTFAGGFIGLATVLSRAKGTQTQEEAHARQAVLLDANNAEARARLALALLARGDHAAALHEAEQALAICPNLSDGHGAYGVILAYSDQPAKAVEALETCVRLDPRSPSLVNRLNQIALAYYFNGDYGATIVAADRAISAFPEFPSPYRWRAAALGMLGRPDASAALAKAMSVSQDAFEFQVRERPQWFRPDDHAHMLDGLRQSGWDG